MPLFSHEIAGVVLPHDHYGSHLDSQGRTVDLALEIQNFQFAGMTLAENWATLVINGYAVVSEYVEPEVSAIEESSLIQKSLSLQWQMEHLRTSQYFLQIVKCSDETCCLPMRSSWLKVVPTRFLPPPFPLIQTEDGLSAGVSGINNKGKYPSASVALSLKPEDFIPRERLEKFALAPYDLYCPSVQSSLASRICKSCGQYFASQVIMKKLAIVHRAAIAARKDNSEQGILLIEYF